MAKKLSLSSIIRPDESEYVDASQLDAGLTDAYEPVASGSALHARPLPVTIYTVDDESMDLPDAPLARAPMRISRRYTPTNKENVPVLTTKERPEFPLFGREEEQVESGSVYPKPEEKIASMKEVLAQTAAGDFLHHDFEEEMLADFVPTNPHIISLLQKQGKDIPYEVTLSNKLFNKNKLKQNDQIASERIKESPRLFVPDSMRTQSGVKKKITI
jgi:hypothetical protein